MSQLNTSSVIWSLEDVRERVTRRLTNVPEYRAFLAIETPIAEVSQYSYLLAHLDTAKQKFWIVNLIENTNLADDRQSDQRHFRKFSSSWARREASTPCPFREAPQRRLPRLR